jgi:hypothetical protein
MTRRSAYTVLVLLVLVEWAVFSQFYAREILPSFPRMFDQAAYMGRALDVYELWLTRGFISGLRESLRWAWPQGLLLPHEAALGFFLLGPTRTAAVAINFAHLALLQSLIVWLGVRAGRPLSAFALCGVLVSAGAFRAELGGLPDFRLDFAANVLLTALGLLVVYSGGFRSRRASLVVGVVGGVACLTRTILLTYLGVGFGMWFVAALLFRRRPGMRARLINAVLAGALTAVVMLPALAAQFQALAAYYVSGHLTSNEGALRAREFGVITRWDHLTYYLHSAVVVHAGRLFAAGAALLLALVAVRWRAENAANDDTPPPLVERDGWWASLFIVCVALSAFVVLTANISKSPIVGNVFVGLAVAFLWALVGTAHERTGVDWERPRWFAAGLLAVFIAGSLAFVVRWTRPTVVQPHYSKSDIASYLDVVDFIATASEALGTRSPKISFDEVNEFFQPDVIRVLAFERHGVILSPQPGLGAIRIALPALEKPAAIADLGNSDFALLGSDRPAQAHVGAYPVNQSLQVMSADLLAWASANMVPIREASFFGRRVTVFVKPSMTCDGRPGEWVTSAGIRCHALGAVVRRLPLLELEGGANAEYLGGDPAVHARISGRNVPATDLTCTYERRAGPAFQPYTVQCSLCGAARRGADLSDTALVAVAINFDRYFVPRAIGLNADERALVVQWPDRVQLKPDACDASPQAALPAQR